MRALRVDVKTQVTVLINDDDDYWAIKHNAMQQVHDDIHWHLKDKFIIDYEQHFDYDSIRLQKGD